MSTHPFKVQICPFRLSISNDIPVLWIQYALQVDEWFKPKDT